MRVRNVLSVRKSCFAELIFGAAVVLMLAFASLPVAAQEAGPAPVKTAGQTGRNIQVLKDLPADQLITTMRFFSYSLGVECQFCHVAGDNSKDDKRQKQTARNMITMEIAINKDNFKGRTSITCYTCHRGAQEPGPVQVADSTRMGNPAAAVATPANAAAEAPNLPTADAVLAKYVEALGGEQALRKITSKTITGTRETAGRNSQTDVASVEGTFEEYDKAPNLHAMFAHTPNGQTTATGFDGTSAWTQNANGVVSEANGTALARAKRAADFYEPLDLKQEYSRLMVRGINKVGDRDAYLVIGVPDGDAPERLYFDTQTGLLLRRVTTLQNMVIATPTQTDYLDYRDANGVKYPSTIKIADVAGSPAYAVLHVQKIEFHVDDSKLPKPASKTAPSPGAR